MNTARLFICVITLLIAMENLSAQVLRKGDFKHYIEYFNEVDNELYRLGEFPNEKAWEFISQSVPFFECPDKQLEQTYYFRWWTYRKHIRKSPAGYIITEFLPDVRHAGVYNTIACPGSLQFMEGRWIKDAKYLDDYARFWLLNEKAEPRRYSFWIADAIINFNAVHPNKELIGTLFEPLGRNFEAWKKSHKDSTGMYKQYDDRDGMEKSISGKYGKPFGWGYRPTINSYMYADAIALAEMAGMIANDKAEHYKNTADTIRRNINSRLWDYSSEFYKVIPVGNNGRFSDARELHGYTPWTFNIPSDKQSVAWSYIMNSKHFLAPYGLTTAEMCHPLFAISYRDHKCQWNGPVWPFSTSMTLTGMANLLNNYTQEYVSKRDYLFLLGQYSKMHTITMDDGTVLPWIDENMNPFTGDWIARSRLKTWKNGTWPEGPGGIERGKDYNHSTFNDLIISGLIGLRTSNSDTLVINPLVPQDAWQYFCLDDVLYRGHTISVFYDYTGKKYGKGKGFFVIVDGKTVSHTEKIEKVSIKL